MDDVVRFYWRAYCKDLPIASIPDRDRVPLLVRRSVVEQELPEVIQQLKEGRFVAAGWKSNDQILITLCHPDLAKAQIDAVMVNTPALPELVVRVADWSLALESAKLFLTAFGSDASDIEKCQSARRQLVAWLTDHNQARSAAAARRYSNFPFGIKSDSLEVVNSWRRIVVNGKQEQIDRFLANVDEGFTAIGWLRDIQQQKHWNVHSDPIKEFFCWASNTSDKPNFVLCLNRRLETRVRGSLFDVRDNAATVPDLARTIQHVLAAVLDPAASRADLKVCYARLGPKSRVGLETQRAMMTFADLGAGQWPLSNHLEGFWRTIVLEAMNENAAIDPNELLIWFIANGWDEDVARQLVSRFYSDSELLEQYEQGRQPAWH